MNLAAQIASYVHRGFTREQAEVIAMMRLAAGVLFRDLPESFLLFGGATLLLFHDSVRHSADLDLLGRGERDLPSANDIQSSISKELESAAEALNLGPLKIGASSNHVLVDDRHGRRLFKIDITRMGSVFESAVEEHTVDIGDGGVATVKSPTRDFLLLQKAECFLLRKYVKARDAFDIHCLRESGIRLSEQFENHLDDALKNNEIDADAIAARIKQVNERLCKAELQSVLPTDVFDRLEREHFQPLRDPLNELYARWLKEN